MVGRRASAPHEFFDGFESSAAVPVLDDLLARIYDGSLPSGSPVSENEVARRAGVSRTPARDAIQRLREIGLVETTAGRTSRVATITEERLGQVLVVWEALFGAVIDEVTDLLGDEEFAAMESAAERFRTEAAAGRGPEGAQANFDLFTVPLRFSRNPALVKATTAHMYSVRLGAQSLPRWIDARALAAAQQDLIAAFRNRDRAGAKAATRAATGYRLVDE